MDTATAIGNLFYRLGHEKFELLKLIGIPEGNIILWLLYVEPHATNTMSNDRQSLSSTDKCVLNARPYCKNESNW